MSALKNAICLAALTSIAVMGYTNSASAFSFRITKGIDRHQDQSGKIVSVDQCQALGSQCTTLTNRGAFSEFAGMQGVTTIDFDNGAAPTTGVVQFSSQSAMVARSGRTGVYSDRWAPSGVRGEENKSNYLAVFQDNKVLVTLQRTMNYFGINWGAMSSGNTFTFMNSKTGFRQTYSYNDVNPLAQTVAAQHNNEGNGFVHFYANAASEVFDSIEISQVGGGGFEVDNFSFHEGSGGFDFDKKQSTPEPGLMLGLFAVGGVGLLIRKGKVQAQDA